MKTILAVSFWLLLGNLSLIRGEDACSFNQRRVTMDYNETVIGVQILDIEVNSETTITSWTVQEANSAVTDEKAKSYFEMNIDNGHLIVSTTNLFGNLGDDADSSGNSLGFTMFVNVSCATTNQAIIVIIKDTFKNSPKFAKESYTYSLPMPIMQRTDITLYGDEIDIFDSNFANTEMTLSISPSEDFNVSASKTDNKHFTAVFSAKRILRFNENQSYVLTASNSGNKRTSVSIVIAVNAEEGLDAPSFTNTYYTFDYSNEGSGSLTPKDGDIAINSDKPNEAQYEISGDYASYFTLKFDNATKKFDLQLNPNEVFPSNIPSQIVLSISFTTDATTNAILLVNIVKEVIPKFTSNYYTGTYDTDSNTITWKENVDVTDASDVTLSDDVSKLLMINPTTYEITPLSSLSKSNFDENLNIVFTVTASSSTKNEAYCTVVISLKTEATDDFKFDHVYYKGKYSEQDKSGVVVLDSEIGFTDISDTEGIEIEVDNDYKTNFKIEPDSSSKWQISIINSLNSSILNDNSKLAIPITATKAGASTSATAVLILSLPVPIKFDNSYYAASYLEGTDGDSVELAQDITVTGINEGDDIAVTVGDDYKTNFKIEPDSSSKWQVSIISRLNSTVLNDNSKLAIPITATKAGASTSVTAVFILSLPVPIKFDNSYYAASYLEETVKLAQDITVTGIDEEDDIKITVGDDYKNNFQITQDQSKKWQISVITSLNATTLRENKQLAIPITASKAGASGSSTAVLILTLPDKNDIKFDSSYYSASYLRGNNVDSLVLDQSLRITGAKESDEITIKVGEGLEDNFEGTCNSTTLECNITVAKSLNESVLSVFDQLLVTLIATTKGQSGTGESVLLLKLPSKNSTFSFSKPYYSANYLIQKSDTEEATISLEDVISFENATTDIDIVPQYYSEYFGFRFNSSTWNLNLVKNLEEDILEHATQLIVTLIATKQDDSSNVAKSALIIKLPDKLTIAFTKQNYYGEYVIDDPSSPEMVLDSDYEIELLDSDNCKIVLDTFADNFVIVQDINSKWTLNIAQPLNSSILTQYSELNIMITITKINISYGTAGLTIKLPSLSFSEDVYSSEYSVDENDVGNIIVSKDIKIDNVDPEYVQLNLTDYGEYFYTERIDDKWTIKVGKSLPATLTDGSPLITSLVARRQNDKILATSTLVISMPSENGTYAPTFSTFIYYGNYKNTDTPTVELIDSISFESENFVKISEVYIDSAANYSSNFIVENGENDQYSIKVETPLIQDVVNDVISIALTLVAKSTEGNYGYATLVIELPRKERNTSVQVENQEILFTGTYKNGVFTIPTIPIVTNSTDDADISVDISNDLGLDNKYFKYTYSNKTLSVEVNDLPDDVLKKTSVIPLKLAITDRNTQDTIYAVLNMQITSSSNDNSGDNNGDNSGDIGLIIAVSILAALLGLLLLGGFLFWFFKLRNNRKYAEMTDDNVETPAKTSTFTKNENKKPVPQLSSPQRRPTGLPIGFISPPSEETPSDQDASIDTSPSNEKRVVFNDRVDKIEQDNEVDEDADDEDASDEFQSVAARRPTKFVFGYPLEEGVLDDPTERRESSDFINRESSDSPDFVDSGRKKSVAFDENVERMHIDPVEGAEDESDSEASGTAEENTNDTPSSQSVGGDELLPSQIFKEIF